MEPTSDQQLAQSSQARELVEAAPSKRPRTKKATVQAEPRTSKAAQTRAKTKTKTSTIELRMQAQERNTALIM